MAEPQSPFEQDDDAPPSPPPERRRRRPWWRWNVLTLLAGLFVLAWVRELGGFSLGLTWLCVFTIFFLWSAGPVPFVESPADAPSRGGLPVPPWRLGGDAIVRVLRGFSLVMMVGGLIYAACMLATGLGMFGRGGVRYMDLRDWLRAGAFVAMPLLEVMAAGILYTLTVIAGRLERLTRER